MSMVFLMEKDTAGVYRVKPVETKNVPVILCREAAKFVLLTPMPCTKAEVEAYVAKHVKDTPPSQEKPTEETVGEEEVDVLAGESEESDDPISASD